LKTHQIIKLIINGIVNNQVKSTHDKIVSNQNQVHVKNIDTIHDIIDDKIHIIKPTKNIFHKILHHLLVVNSIDLLKFSFVNSSFSIALYKENVVLIHLYIAKKTNKNNEIKRIKDPKA